MSILDDVVEDSDAEMIPFGRDPDEFPTDDLVLTIQRKKDTYDIPTTSGYDVNYLT